MIPCLGCERARDLLDAYVDGELRVSEHVAVEAHVRVCSVCTARVEDLQLISTSLRRGALASTRDDERALAGLQAGMLARLRAERDQAVASRLREAFVDLRLLWPALGAIGAVAVGVSLAFGMLSLAGNERAESLSGMIQSVARGGGHAAGHESRPGTERNPLTLDRTMIEIPRIIDDEEITFTGIPEDQAVFARVVVNPSGRISEYEMLGAARAELDSHLDAREADLHEAVSRLRFAPGVGADGSSVAVEMVVAVAMATATPARPQQIRAAQPAAPPPAPAPVADDTQEHVDDGLDDEPAFHELNHDSGHVPHMPRLPWT